MTDARLVVGAIIVDSLERPTRVLAARRTAPPSLAGKWEFPGGKVESGETPEDALRRELREELSIEVNLGDELQHPSDEVWPASGGFSMRLYWTAIAGVQPVVMTGSHDEVRWLAPPALDAVDWLTSDLDAIPLISRVLRA